MMDVQILCSPEAETSQAQLIAAVIIVTPHESYPYGTNFSNCSAHRAKQRQCNQKDDDVAVFLDILPRRLNSKP